ncbi:hypothetical protein HDV00_003568 [Rhizophlyctis rosea]|nr:hypothetical protein HDV00_003568 [Rhizophlyctis rosea]
MFCSLSGEPPEQPVVSTKSGALFERRLITKYIADNGRDPVNGEALTTDDLIEVKANKIVKPRPPTASSVPTLLMSLQNEWDSVVLETYQLKQQYNAVRQELSRALYENDAAKRVIARLAKERDEARATLANVKATYGGSAPAVEAAEDSMDVDEGGESKGLSEQDITAMQEKANSLSKTRRKRKAPPTLATVEEVGSYTKLNEVSSLSSSTNGGVISLDLLIGDRENKEWVLAGARDGQVAIVDWRNAKVIDTAKAHTKRINSVAWHREEDTQMFFTASADKSVKSWKYDAESDGATVISASQWSYAHGGEVTGIDVHATGSYLLAVSADSTWSLADVATGKVLVKVAAPGFSAGYTAGSFHPDGLIVGTGTSDSTVKIWDVKSQTNVKTFEGHVGKVTSLSFSENGYYLATVSDGEAVVKLWDLRNLTNFENISVGGDVKGVQRARFDYSGQYLGVAAGREARIYKVKQWNEVGAVSGHEKEITDLRFGHDAKYLVTGGLDRKVVVSGVQE